MSYISAAQAKQIAQKAVNNLKDGTLVPKLAENLTPYAEDSGTTQTQPFFLEGTATGNGESRVDAKQVPAYAFLQEKRGNMVTVNQLVSSMIPSQQVGGLTITRDENGYLNVSGTSDGTLMYNQLFISDNLPQKANHIYLVFRNKSFTNKWGMSGFILNKTSDFFIHSYTADFAGRVALYVPDGEIFNITGLKVYIVDLTQWFNGNIPAYLLSHPEAFGRYYKGSLAYDPGRLEPATGRYLTSVGRNIWDEEWESGSLNTNTGEKIVNSETIRSKNYISINSNTQYWLRSGGFGVIECFYDADYNYISNANIYDAAFTTPSNAHYMLFRLATDYGTTYNHDITISLYYSGESGYDKYYPYEVLATIDTGTESLYSAGSAYDSKVPSGLITRRIGNYTFTGNETWTKNSNGYQTSISGFSNLVKRPSANNVIFSNQINSAGLKGTSPDRLYVGTEVSGIGIATNGDVWIGSDDYANISTLTGKTVYFELAEPTAEQGTPFQENVPIDDFGQLSWSNTNVPQGNQIFYPVDYKAYEDTLIKYTDGDATSIALKNAITDAALNARGYYKMADILQTIGASGMVGGTLRQQLANSESIAFENTNAIDLYGQTYVRVDIGIYSTTLTKANNQKILNTKYKKAADYSAMLAEDKTIYNGGTLNNVIYIHDSSLTDNDKSELFGVLLAYEKAST